MCKNVCANFNARYLSRPGDCRSDEHDFPQTFLPASYYTIRRLVQGFMPRLQESRPNNCDGIWFLANDYQCVAMLLPETERIELKAACTETLRTHWRLCVSICDYMDDMQERSRHDTIPQEGEYLPRLEGEDNPLGIIKPAFTWTYAVLQMAWDERQQGRSVAVAEPEDIEEAFRRIEWSIHIEVALSWELYECAGASASA